MKTMSSMGVVSGSAGRKRGRRDRSLPTLNVDRNRVRVRDGARGDLIRKPLGSLRFRSTRACRTSAWTPRGAQFVAGSGHVDVRRPMACRAPQGPVDADHAGVSAGEAAEGDAAGGTATVDMSEHDGVGRGPHLRHRGGGGEPGDRARQPAAQAWAGTGAQDGGNTSMTFRASSPKQKAVHEPRTRTIRAKTRSSLHYAAMCRKTIIWMLHAGEGPVVREVSLTPLGNKTEAGAAV